MFVLCLIARNEKTAPEHKCPTKVKLIQIAEFIAIHRNTALSYKLVG